MLLWSTEPSHLLTLPGMCLTNKIIVFTWAWLDPFCFTQSSLVSVSFLLLSLSLPTLVQSLPLPFTCASALCNWPNENNWILQPTNQCLVLVNVLQLVLKCLKERRRWLILFQDELLLFHVNHGYWSPCANGRKSFLWGEGFSRLDTAKQQLFLSIT